MDYFNSRLGNIFIGFRAEGIPTKMLMTLKSLSAYNGQIIYVLLNSKF